MKTLLCLPLLLCGLLPQALSAGPACSGLRIGVYSDFPTNPAVLSLITSAYQQAGCSFETVAMPSPRSLEAANAGQLDGELGRRPGLEKDYPHLLALPTPVMVLNVIAVTSNPDLKDIHRTELNRYRQGSFLGVMSYGYLGLNAQAIQQVRTDEQLLQMLRHRRIDFALIPEPLLQKWQQETDSALFRLPEGLGQVPIHHYLHERHRDLIPVLDAALQTVLRSRAPSP